MPYPMLDRSRVRMADLAERRNKVVIARDCILPDTPPGELDDAVLERIAAAADRIRLARDVGKPVVLAFGAHTIKNGLAPVLIKLIEDGWLTHLATNGAGVIHDWEFSFLGESSEDVRANVAAGRFGNWQETGFNINLAINLGAYEGKGYGEAVGAFIDNDGVKIPSPDRLLNGIADAADAPLHAALSAYVLELVQRFDLKFGKYQVDHAHKQYSVQAAACRAGIPFTSHPMFGHDIIYNHPMNCGALLGQAAERDFLTFAKAISNIDGGVYLSLGSAVMSPMIFEKSMAMAQNLAIQSGAHIDDHYIVVVDLAECSWDWSRGEPPPDNPAYYLRYNKSFSRMGGTMQYLQADNRDFLLHLTRQLA